MNPLIVMAALIARVAAMHVFVRGRPHATSVDPRDKREDDGKGEREDDGKLYSGSGGR